MLIDIPQNDSGLFDCFTTISSSPAKPNKEMATKETAGYLYTKMDRYPAIHFDFVTNPFLSTMSKINQLLLLNDNWDGYNGKAVFPKVGENAFAFISCLNSGDVEKITDIFPNSHGTLTLEWENKEDEKLALEIGSNSYSYFVSSANKQPILGNGKNLLLDMGSITSRIKDILV